MFNMSDGRFLPDNLSASSEDSLKPTPPLDPSSIKPGPGALPPAAFDPLKHEEWQSFWATIDQHFQPMNEHHMRDLRAIPVNPYGGMRDFDLRLPREIDHHEAKLEPKRNGKQQINILSLSPTKQDETNSLIKAEDMLVNLGMTSTNPCSASHSMFSSKNDLSAMVASLNSFPYAHRLAAAMLDERGPGSAPPPSVLARCRANNAGNDCFWMGVGNEADIRIYQAALEDRVKLELSETGLLDITDDEPLQTALRKEQWVLRDVKTTNRMRKWALCNRIVLTELRQQAIDREIKRHCDQVEMLYLSRMIRAIKKNKKSRSKVQKLLQRMFGHYKDKDRTNDKEKKAFQSSANGRFLTNGDEKARGGIKKKKKKSDLGPSEHRPC